MRVSMKHANLALLALVALGLSACTKAKLLGNRITGAIEIFSIIPPAGPITGGTHVLLNGQNFKSGMQVVIGSFVCTDVVVSSSTQANCVTSESTEPGYLSVIGIQDNGSSNTNVDYEYIQVVTNERTQIDAGGTAYTEISGVGGTGPAEVGFTASLGVRGPLAADLASTGETSYLCTSPTTCTTAASIYHWPSVQGAFHYYLFQN